MFHMWKNVDRVMLLMWDWKDRELSRTTPKLLTWEEVTMELSMEMERGLNLCCEGRRRNSRGGMS